MKKYIINNEIEFSPGENRISSIAKPELYAVITAPACKCFSILLKSAPELVTHDELLNRVWGDNGMLVPINTLYQNISIIRRGIKMSKPGNEDIIKSVSKKGFQIFPGVIVDEIDVDIPITTEADTIVDSRAKYKNVSLVIYMLLVLGVTCLLILFKTYDFNKGFYQDFNLEGHSKGCYTYSNARLAYEKEKLEQIAIKIDSLGLICKTYPWRYIYVYKSSSVSSAIVCRYNIQHKTKDNCMSLYLRD